MKAGRLLPLLAVPMAGCAQLYDFRDTLEGYTNPLVASAMFLGVQEPDSEFIDLLDTEFESGAVVQAFLADASNVDDMSKAPIAGGDLKVRIGGADPLRLDEVEAGTYSITGGEGLYYEVGQSTTLSINVGPDTGRIEGGKLPEAADVVLDWEQSAEDLVVDMSDRDYDIVLAVVVDMDDGAVLWTNEPADISELYDMTHASEAVKRVVIPGAIFQKEGILAVGVAGMMVTDQEQIEGVNIALSSYMSGQMVFNPVCTYDSATCAVITPEDMEDMEDLP